MLAPLALVSLAVSGLPPFVPQGPSQVPDAVNVFFGADDVSGPLAGAVLLCRVDIVGDRGWDTFGAVDLSVTFTIGKRAPIEVWGPEDRSSAVVSVPAVDLAPGQKIGVQVEDRDVTERELIARGHIPYAGKLPLRIDLQDVQLECRAVDNETAVARAQPALAKASHAIASMAAVRPDLRHDDVGAPREAHYESERQLGIAAAWVGADDAGVRAGHASLATALAAFDERARAKIVEVKGQLPPPGGVVPLATVGLDARVLAGPSLVLEVTAPATGDPVTFRDEDVAALVVLFDETGCATFTRGCGGIIRTVTVVPGRDSDASGVALAPGAVRKIRLRPSSGSALPALARIDGVLARVR